MTATGFESARSSQQGASLIEILVGAVIAAVLVGGLMGAFLTAVRISARGGGNTEAAALAQQTLERLRNKVACDSGWFGGGNCGATPPAANSADPLLGGALNGGTRTYTVTPANCGSGPGDCLKVVAKVSWTPPQ